MKQVELDTIDVITFLKAQDQKKDAVVSATSQLHGNIQLIWSWESLILSGNQIELDWFFFLSLFLAYVINIHLFQDARCHCFQDL